MAHAGYIAGPVRSVSGSRTRTISGTSDTTTSSGGADWGDGWASAHIATNLPAIGSATGTVDYQDLPDPYTYNGPVLVSVLVVHRSSSGGVRFPDESGSGYAGYVSQTNKGAWQLYRACHHPPSPDVLAAAVEQWLEYEPNLADVVGVPHDSPASDAGEATVDDPGTGSPVTTGLYVYTPAGWGSAIPADTTDYDFWVACLPNNGTTTITAPDRQDGTWHVWFTLTLYQWMGVDHPTGEVWPPDTIDPVYSTYGLSTDTHVLGGTRQVYNAGLNSAALKLRRFYGPEDAPFDMALPFTGKSPSLVCEASGTHLVAVNNGTVLEMRRISDEGGVLQTMATPGTGKLNAVYKSRREPAAPVLCAVCDKDTGTGATISVYRSFDAVNLSVWEGPVTVIDSTPGVPAQRPTLTGDNSRYVLGVHDGTNPLYYESIDMGATWTEVV